MNCLLVSSCWFDSVYKHCNLFSGGRWIANLQFINTVISVNCQLVLKMISQKQYLFLVIQEILLILYLPVGFIVFINTTVISFLGVAAVRQISILMLLIFCNFFFGGWWIAYLYLSVGLIVFINTVIYFLGVVELPTCTFLLVYKHCNFCEFPTCSEDDIAEAILVFSHSGNPLDIPTDEP
jgi:hypothetical protein